MFTHCIRSISCGLIKMNILQVLPELNVGGVETGTVDLARYLVKMGHKAVVVSNGGDLVKENSR